MKNKITLSIFLVSTIIGMIATTVLSVYYVMIFKAASSFDTFSFIMMILFIILTLGLLGVSFMIFIRILSIKGDNNGKDS